MIHPINCRKLYEKYHNVKLEDDQEVHHIVPLHDGGTNEIDNLIVLTKEEHKLAHMKRYEETGNFKDLCSYHMIGYNFSEAHKVSSSVGGKIGGAKVKQLGIGICSTNETLRKQWASLGGKAGGKVQYENKIGIHSQTTEERLKLASIGGKRGAFTQSKWQSEFGKRGGVKNKGFVWLTDGQKSIKYTKKQQEEQSVDQFLINNKEFKRGRYNHGKNKIN
jgi:hypothetical protein